MKQFLFACVFFVSCNAKHSTEKDAADTIASAKTAADSIARVKQLQMEADSIASIKSIQNQMDALPKETSPSLADSIDAADYIVIASHYSTNYPLRDPVTKKPYTPKLMIDGKPNDKIIHQKKKLRPAQVRELKNILMTAVENPYKSYTKCFQPRHAVFLYKNQRIEYLDFCFECTGYNRSPEFPVIIAFDEAKWRTLSDFFRKQGISDDLPW
jgi:hypothetical protein